MNPSNLSKINTTVQILLVIFVLAQLAHWLSFPLAVDVLIVIVTVTTIWSGAHYVWFWGFRRDTNAGSRVAGS